MSTISNILSAPPDNFSTTLSANISNSALTIPLNSTTGLGTEGVGVIYAKDADGNPITSTIEFVHWTGVSGLNLTLTNTGDRGITGSASGAQAHSAGETFEVWVHSKYYSGLGSAILAEHTSAGAHTTDTISEKTAGAGVTIDGLLIKDGHIQVADGAVINDANGNEILKILKTASAVNEFTIQNATTGNKPVLLATGEDTNIGIDIRPKGSGIVRTTRVVEMVVVPPSSYVTTGDGKAVFEVPEELAGLNIVAVGAYVYTAGTTGTMDIQLRNVTSGADILSTKITIDSGEVSSRTAATPPVINTAEDDLTLGDIIAVDVDAVQTTRAQGLVVWFRAALP